MSNKHTRRLEPRPARVIMDPVRVVLLNGGAFLLEPVPVSPEGGLAHEPPGVAVAAPKQTSCPEQNSSLGPLVSRLEAVAANLEKPHDPAWLTHDEAAARLRVHPETLSNTMVHAASAGTPAPAVNIGSEARPRYRWAAADLDDWWLQVRGVGKGQAQGKTQRKTTRRCSRRLKGRGKARRKSLRDRLRDPLDSAAPDREA